MDLVLEPNLLNYRVGTDIDALTKGTEFVKVKLRFIHAFIA